MMKLSARNQFQGTVTHIKEGQAMAEVAVKVGNLEFIAAITEGSVKNMGLKVNDSVTVAVKATEVIVSQLMVSSPVSSLGMVCASAIGMASQTTEAL